MSDNDNGFKVSKLLLNISQAWKQVAGKPQVNQVNGGDRPEMKKRKRKEKDKKEADQGKRKEVSPVWVGRL